MVHDILFCLFSFYLQLATKLSSGIVIAFFGYQNCTHKIEHHNQKCEIWWWRSSKNTLKFVTRSIKVQFYPIVFFTIHIFAELSKNYSHLNFQEMDFSYHAMWTFISSNVTITHQRTKWFISWIVNWNKQFPWAIVLQLKLNWLHRSGSRNNYYCCWSVYTVQSPRSNNHS